jgi:signal transduction histidine kinase
MSKRSPRVSRRPILLLVVVLVTITLAVTIISGGSLYRAAFTDTTTRLQETARSQARMMEAMARHAQQAEGGAFEATLAQVRAAHGSFRGFGETGEFTLARRSGDQIEFLLRHRHGSLSSPDAISFHELRAEPMRRALSGDSGTLIGLDYRGETVLAAYEPVALMNLGVVAKIDLEEIRAPFVTAAYYALAAAVILIGLGVIAFQRISYPLIEQVVESEERLLLALESSRLGTWSCSPSSGFSWDDFSAAHFQEDQDHLPGTPQALAELVPSADRAALVSALEEAVSGARALDLELQLAGDSDEPRWLAMRGRRLERDPGVASGTVWDVTAQKEAQLARAALTSELAQKAEEMERFVYTVSHDLKSPLITIQGFLDLLLADASEGDQEALEGDVAQIRRASEQMQALLEDLLELSRIGRLENPRERCPLSEIAEQAVDLLGTRAHGAEIVVAPDLPVVFADRKRIQEVFQNLIENALKFMGDQAAPRVEVGAREEGRERVCYVRDNGVGIAPQFQERVFDLFRRLGKDTPGTGIGLAIVKRIVEHEGGRIWIESDGEAGSTFCFVLPAKEEG